MKYTTSSPNDPAIVNPKRNKSKATLKSVGIPDEHEDKHSSAHINHMKRLMKTGIAFTVAHKQAMKKVGK